MVLFLTIIQTYHLSINTFKFLFQNMHGAGRHEIKTSGTPNLILEKIVELENLTAQRQQYPLSIVDRFQQSLGCCGITEPSRDDPG